jgi:hypothetical protein
MDVPLTGVYLISVRLIDVYLIGAYNSKNMYLRDVYPMGASLSDSHGPLLRAWIL